jgi:hypothetical protein
MADFLGHDEISQRFLDSKSLDFDAVGRFVTDIGPELTIRDDGLHGVLFGKFNTLACIFKADDLQQLMGLNRARLAQALDLSA